MKKWIQKENWMAKASEFRLALAEKGKSLSFGRGFLSTVTYLFQ
ncbi:hypothetical protein [Leptospira kanakyensis]|nr:hypothetical protein [Leptospira kanakyensis]